MEINAFAWAETAAAKLRERFGERLAFVGLQGSRARGEAHAESDIDLVVVLETVSASDLAAVRETVEGLPSAHLACGFVGSATMLAAWPRHELFQFVNDTHAVFGSLAEIGGNLAEPFTPEDARQAARVGASGAYHALCHAAVFEGGVSDGLLQALSKGAFFTLQASWFARTGHYPATKAELADLLANEAAAGGNVSKNAALEAFILDVGRAWTVHAPENDDQRNVLVDALLRWSESVMYG